MSLKGLNGKAFKKSSLIEHFQIFLDKCHKREVGPKTIKGSHSYGSKYMEHFWSSYNELRSINAQKIHRNHKSQCCDEDFNISG